ncbi:hypothetical protein IAD21_03772 [Abditibacteriota bacterium]|nr:hypothetical protein IAD21_03772 [Abditibacteriota bacterium]
MTDSAPERASPSLSESAPSHPVSSKGMSAGVRLRRKRSFLDWIAFLLSAILSPYLVIPVGTIGIIYARTSHSSHQFLEWVSISLFFSTALPLLYILVGMWRGTISDVHVMERDQRGGPFIIAIIGGFLGAFLLYLLQAPPSVWGLSVIQAVNGLAILAITHFTKISVHVSVLSATVIGATALHPHFPPYMVLWLIPVLMWARTRRGRHSWWQGIAGFVVASGVTSLVIAGLGLSDRLTWLWQRL